jgi:hypothetical protein
VDYCHQCDGGNIGNDDIGYLGDDGVGGEKFKGENQGTVSQKALQFLYNNSSGRHDTFLLLDVVDGHISNYPSNVCDRVVFVFVLWHHDMRVRQDIYIKFFTAAFSSFEMFDQVLYAICCGNGGCMVLNKTRVHYNTVQQCGMECIFYYVPSRIDSDGNNDGGSDNLQEYTTATIANNTTTTATTNTISKKPATSPPIDVSRFPLCNDPCIKRYLLY